MGYDFPPLSIRLAALPPRSGLGDALIEVTADGRTYDFDAEFRARSSPRAFQEALSLLQRMAEQRRDRRALLVTPYLREEQLQHLERDGLSGLDLCGNGVIAIPGKLLVYRTGKPNRYPDSGPTKYAYRGATSLVGRVFLCRPTFPSLSAVADEIAIRGGHVVLSTVSKALKRLEADLIVDRTARGLRLRQPEKLLESLADNFVQPKVTRCVTLSIGRPLPDLLRNGSREEPFALSGQSSVPAYAVMGRAELPVLYVPSVARRLRSWGAEVRETARFAELELRETDDPTVYFDIRPLNGLPYASPIQVFLECNAGDKRERETAADVRAVILRELAA